MQVAVDHIDMQALVDAIMGTRNQIDFLWNFFVTVNMTIFALLFIYDETVDHMKGVGRFFAIAGIAGFDYINGNALRNSYSLLNALHGQYKASFGHIREFTAPFREHFVDVQFAGRADMVLATHSFALAVVALAFVWPNFIQHGKPRKNGESG